MENERKLRNIKLVREILLAIEMKKKTTKKTQILMNKLVYLGLSILSKTE